MADERDEIRSRINIVDLVGQSVLLKKAGKSWKGLCPFHSDKNPSFYVDPTFGTYRCWSCGEHGDIFTWVMKMRHVEFVEALKVLADMAGVDLGARGPGVSKSDKARWAEAMNDALAFFREQLSRSEQAKAYCEKRGLTKETLTEWELGYGPDVGDALANHLKRKGHALSECKELFLVDQDQTGGYFDRFRGRLIFPIRSESGDLVGFGGRLLGEGHPKYVNSGDTPLYRKSKVLYGMHRAKDAMAKEKRAVLVEGYLDVIACHAAGVRCAVASLGTALAEDHARLLRRWCEQVVILYDSDAAGQKAADRAVEILQSEKLRTRVALMPQGEDPDTLLKTAGPAAVQQAVEGGLRPLDYRIRKLEGTYSPDQEEFWTEAVTTLATATGELELLKYADYLAAKYPGATDQLAARKALLEQVKRFKRQRKSAAPDEEQSRPQNPFRSTHLQSPELAVFRGLMEPGLRQLAWNICGETELFSSDLGREVARAIRNAFPGGPPTEHPSIWVGKIEPESARETFIAAQHDPRVEQMTPQFLDDAISKLQSVRRRRELEQRKRDLTGDERLREVYAKLRERQRDENLDAS